MIYKFMQQKHASFDDSPPEHPLTAEPCDRIGEARGVRWSSRSQRTYALIGELGAFSPGLKPGICKIKRSRGFENPLPRTESPGPGVSTFRRGWIDPNLRNARVFWSHRSRCFVSGHDFSRAAQGQQRYGLYRLRKKVEQGAKPVPSAAKAEQICNHLWTA